MDLLPLHWSRFVPSIQRSVILASSIMLASCAVVPTQPLDSEPSATAATTDEVAAEIPSLPLTAEMVYDILTAEIAGQRGEIGVAAELYNNAANLAESPAVAGRSTQIANFTRDQQRIKRALKRWVEVDPTDADVYIMQAPFLMLEGDYDGAVKAVDTALGLAPEASKNYLLRISDSLTELASPEKSLSVLQQLKAYQADETEAVFAYARLATFYKHYDEAMPQVDKVLKKQPSREDALILKSEILQRTGKGSAAMRLLKKAASGDSASTDVRFAYAKLLGENNKIAESREMFQELNAELPENEEVIFALGLIAIQEKDGQEAKQHFNQLLTLGDRGKQAAYFMGLAEELNENNEAAMMWFASVPANSQRFQAAQTNYVNLLAESGQLEKARLHLKLLRTELPERAIQYYLFEASFLREQGQDQAAFDLYNEAIKKYPGKTELLYGRAMVAEPLNKLAVLEADLRAILKLEPENHHALNALGYTLTDRTNRHQEALVLINKAVALQPNDAFYLDSLAWVHYRLGNLEDAERYIKQAVAIRSDPEFLAHLGEILWQRGKQSEARKAWDRGLKQDADNKLILETMTRLGV